MNLRKYSALAAVSAGFLISSVLAAQPAARPRAMAPNPTVWTPAAAAPNYGPTDLTYVRVPASDIFPYQSSDGYISVPGSVTRYPGAGGFAMEATPHVPSGAVIDYFEIDVCDTNAAADMSAFLLDCGALGAGCGTLVSTLTSSGSPGCVAVSTSGIGYQVLNSASTIDVEILFGAFDGTNSLGGVVLGYHLVVSPDPATQTFNDVPVGHPYHRWIEALADAGITGGCDVVPNFCPDRPITRAEMAVFLSLALGLHFPN